MKRGMGWPIGITLILATTVGANIWVMRIASADPSFAIEPHYYAKAVAWDSVMAQERANRALGWRVAPVLRASPGDDGELFVMVTDTSGAPIKGATVSVSAFAVARSSVVVDAALEPDGDGYRARMPVRRGGAWELRFDVQRGGDRALLKRRVDALFGT